MSSYGEWKAGFISDAQYNRECRMEEAIARAEEEKAERRENLREEVEKDMNNFILPEGLYISDVYWDSDKLIIEIEEDEE